MQAFQRSRHVYIELRSRVREVVTFFEIDDNGDNNQEQNSCNNMFRSSIRQMWTKIKDIIRKPITIVGFLIFLLLIILLIFIAIPITFMCSVDFQRSVILPNKNESVHLEFKNFQKYDVNGARNFYVPVKDIDTNANIYLGVWHLIPDALVNNSIYDDNFNYEEQLATSDYPVVLYFHAGNRGSRIAPLATYNVLRQSFHVIGFDYRNYGDSTPATLSETALVSDSVQLYKWLQNRTKANIFIWGFSLGTAISTHTVKILKSEKIFPYGLVLESPFTTMREEVIYHPLIKATILDPLEGNGFRFNTTENILGVDCPIMIMNAEDDSIVPYTMGQKLAEIARTQRNLEYQGNVAYHQFEYKLGYNHDGLIKDLRIPGFVCDFMDECKQFWND